MNGSARKIVGRPVRRGSARVGAALALAWLALAHDGSRVGAQVVEAQNPKPPAEARPTGPVEGTVYTWEDGDRTRRAWLQPDLTVRQTGGETPRGMHVADTGDGVIVRSAGGRGGQPVFRSQSGALMTLPGGVLLVLSPEWSRQRVEAFLAANGIGPDRVSELGFIDNGFLVRTAPGFPSLELANALAGQSGVELSSPNWWRQRATR